MNYVYLNKLVDRVEVLQFFELPEAVNRRTNNTKIGESIQKALHRKHYTET